jgi:ABC-type transporter Mla subunit MlaD
MPSIRVVIEAGPGQRIEVEREEVDLIDGQGIVLNRSQVQPMWTEVVGQVSHILRYWQPAQAQRADE